MSWRQEDYLMLSGIQHFAFCRRQWALIHIEQQWRENERTVDGRILHQKAHDETKTEKRGNLLICRGMNINSSELGVSGQCDIVEFHKKKEGITLFGWDGNWSVYPIEYKNGEPKANNADLLQLCGQAMCLEEMLCCSIEEGSLYYGRTKRRLKVAFTVELREQVRQMLQEMHRFYQKGYTPKVKRSKSCNACSLKEICLPSLNRAVPVADYLRQNEGGGAV